ncbi:hypothetical protein JCM10908_000388 [Rhodotorula pacifica]|uniref:uncharacterized protein n=1 Tax=Rhodotorula pacifica TaxID=1495444 RepID=UPI003175E63C
MTSSTEQAQHATCGPSPPNQANRDILSTLAPELIDFILEELCALSAQDEDPTGRKRAESAVLPIISTCRALEQAGIRRLYRAPNLINGLREEDAIRLGDEGKNRMQRFCDTVCTRPEAALAVQDLSGIHGLLTLAALMEGPTNYMDGEFKQWLGLVGLCTNLTKICISLTSVEQAEQAGIAFAKLAHLSEIEVEVSVSTWLNPGVTDVDVYAACLSPLRLKPVEPVKLAKLTLTVKGHKHDANTITDSTCGLAMILHKLSIEICLRFSFFPYDLDDLRCYLPGGSSGQEIGLPGLAGLEIETFASYEDMCPSTLNVISGNRLVSFNGNARRVWSIDSLSGYRRLTSRCRSDNSDYAYKKSMSLFPDVRHLRLSAGIQMNLVHLEILADNSPKLERLELDGTHWDLSPEELPNLASPTDLSPFEQRLVAILERFKHLEYIHLGIWPYLASSSPTAPDQDDCIRPGLVAWAKERRIRLVVHGLKRQ